MCYRRRRKRRRRWRWRRRRSRRWRCPDKWMATQDSPEQEITLSSLEWRESVVTSTNTANIWTQNIRPGFARTEPGMESASDGGRIRRSVPRPEVRRNERTIETFHGNALGGEVGRNMCIDSVPRFRAAQDEGEAFKANQSPRQSRLVVFAWSTFAKHAGPPCCGRQA
jgi:hypothetical protein